MYLLPLEGVRGEDPSLWEGRGGSLSFHLCELWHTTLSIALCNIDELFTLPTLHILAVASEEVFCGIVE